MAGKVGGMCMIFACVINCLYSTMMMHWRGVTNWQRNMESMAWIAWAEVGAVLQTSGINWLAEWKHYFKSAMLT